MTDAVLGRAVAVLAWWLCSTVMRRPSRPRRRAKLLSKGWSGGGARKGSLLGVLGHPAVGHVALLELGGEPHAALVEEGERDNRLGDADALAAEDAGEAELGHVGGHLADGLGEGEARVGEATSRKGS